MGDRGQSSVVQCRISVCPAGGRARLYYEAGTADPISKGPLQGKSRDYARKISPYNLTSPAYYNGSNALYTPVDHKQAKFVKYPSQAGAFFQ